MFNVRGTPVAPPPVGAGQGIFAFTTGQAPCDWFGPGQSLAPMAQEAALGRAFDYPAGYNLRSRPKSGEGLSFSDMRSLADGYDLMRLVIETRKDQIEKLNWDIKPRALRGMKKVAPDKRIEDIKDFLQSPDQDSTFFQWLRQILEDLLVIDAPAVYVRKTKGGALYALEPIDGATIRRVLDETGRTPVEGPAYQQVLKGVAAVDYTRGELIYMPRNRRTARVYGFSPVEQVITTVNIALRRQMNQLSYYTDGSTPNMLFGVPKEWSPQQTREFQTWWDSLFVGNQAQRSRAKFIPGDVKPIDTKEQALKDEYDEWLARIVCYAFSVSAQPFIKQMNRSTAETAAQQAAEEGLAPMQNWIKAFMDRILRDCFDAGDLEFSWSMERSLNPLERAQVDAADIASGMRSISECRDDRGLSVIEGDGDAIGLDPTNTPQAMDSAQVSSLVQIVAQAASGAIPKETGRAIIRASFPSLDEARVSAIVDPIQVKEPEPTPIPIPPPLPQVEGAGTPKTKPDVVGEELTTKKAECSCGHDHATLEKSTPIAKVSKVKAIKRDRTIVTKAEKKLAGKVKKLFRAQASVIAGQITDAIQERMGKADGALDPKDLDWIVSQINFGGWDSLSLDAKNILSVIASDGGARALEQIGIRPHEAANTAMVNQVNADAVKWAEDRSSELVTSISETTRDQMRSDVTEAIEQGLSTDELADVLADSYGFSDARAEMIARTEIAFADVQGNLAGYRASEVVDSLEWICSSEGGCEICEANLGAVVPLGGTFPSGDEAPPAHPSCVCDALPVMIEVNESEKIAKLMASTFEKIVAAQTSQAPPVVNVTMPPVTLQVEAPKPISKTIQIQRNAEGRLIGAHIQED